MRDNTSAALASYDAASEASVTVLCQCLRTLLLLDPSTPDFIIKMQGVVANSGMRTLGLALMNEELDNAVTVFLLAPHWMGCGRMGDPVIKCVQDSAITILAGLQHDSVVVRDNYENLLAHAGDRTRDIFDPTAARRDGIWRERYIDMPLVEEDSYNHGWKSINYRKQWIWHAVHEAS